MLHLFHPALVHVAVSFLALGSLCEAAGILARREGGERLGGALVLLGTASLVPTVLTGYLAVNSISIPAGAADVVARHERLALVLLAFFLALVLWKAWGRGAVHPSWRVSYAAALLAGAALTAWTAWLGGEMVYLHGVGVLGP